MYEHKSKQKYPNLPEEFRVLVKEARLNQGLTTRVMGAAIGCYPATISQYERGARNFTYENAVKFRDYLNLDYDLPLPRPEEALPIVRKRRVPKTVQSKAFYIVVDNEIIEVRTYRRLGPVTKARLLSLERK